MAYSSPMEPMSHSRLVPVRRSIQYREAILRELKAVPDRILAETGGQIRLKYGEKILDFLMAELTHSSRPGFVKQVLERHLTRPLLRLIYTGQVVADDVLSIELSDDGNALYFISDQSRQSHRSQLL